MTELGNLTWKTRPFDGISGLCDEFSNKVKVESTFPKLSISQSSILSPTMTSAPQSPFDLHNCRFPTSNSESETNELDPNGPSWLFSLQNANTFGELPIGDIQHSDFIHDHFSRKVFIGGLPLGLSGEKVCEFFGRFGHVTVDWPHRDRSPVSPPHGYAFAVFQDVESVKLLLSQCVFAQGKLCIRVSCHSNIGERDKVVQVRPWSNSDRVYCSEGDPDSVNMRYSIFVGGVPRTTTARELTAVLSAAIGPLSLVQIEVDYETEYPKGAARVVFSNRESYVSAVARRHICINSPDQQKEMEMKPYLEDCHICEGCQMVTTRHFCPELRCLKYLCDSCWTREHQHPATRDHRPMVKGLFHSRLPTGPSYVRSYREFGPPPYNNGYVDMPSQRMGHTHNHYPQPHGGDMWNRRPGFRQDISVQYTGMTPSKWNLVVPPPSTVNMGMEPHKMFSPQMGRRFVNFSTTRSNNGFF